MKKILAYLKNNGLNSFLFILVLMAVISACYAYVIYSTAFGNSLAPPISRADWGVMGDFFGGVLNPAFSLLGLIMLLATLHQNQKELELSREELEKSSQALAKQATTLEKQRFEDTFFALLDQLSRIQEQLLHEDFKYYENGRSRKMESTVNQLRMVLSGNAADRMYSSDEKLLGIAKMKLLDFNPTVNQYFRILYQVLKLIATNNPETSLSEFTEYQLESTTASITEKFYSNVVRAFIPENVYDLLAINCSITGNSDPYHKYQLLITRYAFLEHMSFSFESTYAGKLSREIAAHYKAEAFGSNAEYNKALESYNSTIAPTNNPRDSA